MLEEPNKELRVYVPIYNAVDWASRFRIPPGIELIAVDNASTDGTAEVLKNRGITVVQHDKNIGRVENWDFCLRHFLSSSAKWVKLHMAGDSLAIDTLKVWSAVLDIVPSAKLITADWDICANNETRPARRTNKLLSVAPKDAMVRFAEDGNWIGPPLATLLHRDLITDGFNLGTLPWVADMQLFMHCARQTPTILAPGLVGCFNLSERRFHQANVHTMESRCQEAVLRYCAAKNYRELSGDEPGFRKLVEKIDQDIERISIHGLFSGKREPAERNRVLEGLSTHLFTQVVTQRVISRVRNLVGFRN